MEITAPIEDQTRPQYPNYSVCQIRCLPGSTGGVEEWGRTRLDQWGIWAFSQGHWGVMVGSEKGGDKVRFILLEDPSGSDVWDGW